MRLICKNHDFTIAKMQIVCKYEGVDKFITDVDSQLRESKLRVTDARIAVLSLLQSVRKPLTPSEVIGLLHGKSFDQATVYRTLSALVEKGLVQAVSMHPGVTSYEIASLPHHHHMVCVQCGYVEDVQSCKVPEHVSTENTGFARVLDHALEFAGVCRQCS